MDINRVGNRWEVGTFSCGHPPSRHSSGEVEGCITRQKALTIEERSVLRTLASYELERRSLPNGQRKMLEGIQRKLTD